MDPFGKRAFKRILIFFAIFICGSPILIGPFIALLMPFFFTINKLLGRFTCKSIINKQYSEVVHYIQEVYHPKQQWGFLAVANHKLIFIPKHGLKDVVLYSDIAEYDYAHLSTGSYTTTYYNNIGITSENTARAFYIQKHNHSTDYWYTRKNKAFYKSLNNKLQRYKRNVNY